MSKMTVPGNSNVADAACVMGVQSAFALSTTADAVPVRVGAANAVRKLVTVYNNSDTTIYWGWNSGVYAESGTPILGHTLMTFAVNKHKDVYLVVASEAKIPPDPEVFLDIRITEVI